MQEKRRDLHAKIFVSPKHITDHRTNELGMRVVDVNEIEEAVEKALIGIRTVRERRTEIEIIIIEIETTIAVLAKKFETVVVAAIPVVDGNMKVAMMI
jgi:hypothetical protein